MKLILLHRLLGRLNLPIAQGVALGWELLPFQGVNDAALSGRFFVGVIIPRALPGLRDIALSGR